MTFAFNFADDAPLETVIDQGSLIQPAKIDVLPAKELFFSSKVGMTNSHEEIDTDVVILA